MTDPSLIDVTVDVRDLDATVGPAPGSASVSIALLNSTEDGGVLVTSAPVSVTLVDGHGVAELQPDTDYLIRCYGLAGFRAPFAVRTPTGPTSLGELWRTGQIDPVGFAQRPVPSTVTEAIAAFEQAAADLYATKADLAAAGGGMQYVQPAAAGQWSIPHAFGRRPAVALYDSSGALMLADVVSTASLVVVTFATPTAGSAVLT